MNTIRKFCFLLALMLGAGLPGFAATVSGTFTTNIGAGAISSALFVKAGEKASFQLLNTFVATVQLESSRNGGLVWEPEYSSTTTVARALDAKLYDVTYRLRASAYTSGTVTYYLDNRVYVPNRVKFTNVPVGSVAYGSFGSVRLPWSGELMIGTLFLTDLVIPRDMTVTGIGILNGATCGTDKYALWLFDGSGLAIGNTDLAGTTCSGTDAFQEIAITSEVAIKAGLYHVGARVNGSTDRTRFVAASTFPDVRTSLTQHSSILVGSFGSTIFGIPTPTTFTAAQAPIVYVYGR